LLHSIVSIEVLGVVSFGGGAKSCEISVLVRAGGLDGGHSGSFEVSQGFVMRWCW